MTCKEMCTKMATTVLEELKNECKKFEYCSTECVFYVNATGECLLKQCPVDYEMTEIQKAVSNLIETESKMYE